MFRYNLILLSFMILIAGSCKKADKYSYAIKDFRESLRPHFLKILSKGVILFPDSSLSYLATDKELIQLGNSEHPLLRVVAFREMLSRKTFDDYNLLMNHLDDTAIIPYEAGEWGIHFTTVSDYILENAEWKDLKEKDHTIHEVITKHNYLRSAYTILERIEPLEKYYSYIKDMSFRERLSVLEQMNYEVKDFEFALYGLAKFKKKEDVTLIKNVLLRNKWALSELSFRLMSVFPDTSYLDVFEEYYKRCFYRIIYQDQREDKAESFISSIASYKNERSAKILSLILSKERLFDSGSTKYLKQFLFSVIRQNQCPAYVKLLQQITREVNDTDILIGEYMPIDSVNNSTGPITWFY